MASAVHHLYSTLPSPLKTLFGFSAHEYLRQRESIRQVKGLPHRDRKAMSYTHHHRGLAADPDPSFSLGLSAIIVLSLEDAWRYCYVSESFRDILGYESTEIVGERIDSLWHPDEFEMTRQVQEASGSAEQTACVVYFRLRHKKGGYVNICGSYSVAYDKVVGIYTLAENGPLTLRQARTARAVYEITPSESGGLTQRMWPKSLGKSRSQSPSATRSPPSLPLDAAPRDPSAERTPRTIFIMDRFTDTATVNFVSNDIIVKGASLPSHSFYSIVRPSHRPEARRWIDAAKNWSPVQKSAARSGGHGFASFEVLKIPDLPPRGDRFPRGTDEGERHMPGQEFIPVEAIFTASSDGVVCVIERLRPKSSSSAEEGNRHKSDGKLLQPPGSSHSSAPTTAVENSELALSRQSTLISSREASPTVKVESED